MWNALSELGDMELTPDDVYNLKGKSITKNTVRRNHEEQNLFEKLPEDLLFDILVSVPAMYIHENARLVCKAWRKLTSSSEFIAKNAAQTKTKLFIQWFCSDCFYNKIRVMDIGEDQLDYQLHDSERGLCKKYFNRSSCNGLILVLDYSKQRGIRYVPPILKIMNLTTKNSISLPPCLSNCQHRNCGIALGFDPFTNKYKVVHIMTELSGFEILTVDGRHSKWRLVSGPWKDPIERPFGLDFDWSDPVVINGRFMHWYVDSNEYIVSMDISSEGFVKTRISQFTKKNDECSVLQIDEHLALVQDVSNAQIDIWILDDFHSQTWLKKHSIRAELTNIMTFGHSSSSTEGKNHVPDMRKLIPIGSARKGQVLIFKHSGLEGRIYLYDIKQRQMKKFKMTTGKLQDLIPHKSTLVHLKT